MNRRPLRDLGLAIALCIVGAILGKMQTTARNAGADDLASKIVRGAISPAASLLTSVSNGLSDFWTGIVSANGLMAENRRLRSIQRAASLYNEQVRRYQHEIDRLRKMLDMPDAPGRTKVPAVVTGYLPHENRATLGVGSSSGIRKGMPVVTADGLVGVVQTVSPGSSQMLLISSAQLRIVGMVEREPPPVGFISGHSADSMMLEVLDSKSVVQNGDTVVTSGLSDRIPQGIPIGKIVQIEEDEAFGSRRCQVFPAVQVGSIREVFVLR